MTWCSEDSATPRFVLASSAIRCRFVDRFVRLRVLSRVSRQRFSSHDTPLPSIDGVTAADYATNLEANLLDLLDRIKSGRYKAPPVRRTYIPKTDGSRRPLGIPTFEDKLAQRAIVMVLEAVYEQDFLPCSFGFRPGRSAHQALQSLHTAVMGQGLRWVIDIDIVKYFDSIPHSQLRDFLDQRVPSGIWLEFAEARLRVT